MSFAGIVTAALSETRSKFDLADALLREIPRRPHGNRYTTYPDLDSCLEEARQAIIDAGGEPKSVSTLRGYRDTAVWCDGNWLPGVSFTAHRYAMALMTYAEFAAKPMNSTELRRMAQAKITEREAILDETAREIAALKAKAMEAFEPFTQSVEITHRGDPAIPSNVQVVFWATALGKLLDLHSKSGYAFSEDSLRALKALESKIASHV